MEISFLGACGTVTGSMYLITTDKKRKILVDGGVFQGEWEDLNHSSFPFDPYEIDYVILTHAHLDHIGRLPKLVKEGFEGKILGTPATLDLARIILMDAAKLQSEEFETQKKRNDRKGIETPEPLYTLEDAIATMSYFKPISGYDKEIEILEGVTITWRDAGHILGSAFLEMTIDGHKVVFSGDLGNRNKPIIRDPESIKRKDAELIVVESTYGSRLHKSIEESKEEFLNALKETLPKGNVVIPSFAIERAQDLLYYIREFKEEGLLSKDVKVFLDSPLAISATNIFRAHKECFDDEARELLKQKRDLFSFPNLFFTRSKEASMEINNIKSGAIIIAGSGMCTGGRIKHHLKHNLWREECAVIFVGYQATGTLGRRIVDGEKEVEIYGETVKVNAKIYTINGFSAHADQQEILDWLSSVDKNTKVVITHGEEVERDALAEKLKELGFNEILKPKLKDIITL
uniref:MBL fold metallo-hydrolase n=1 Tax=candidate division WOR-3 bacterium TaxID=2052148 RepID=A0A7V3NTC8_UNCW3